jgi:hypothetical protein
LYTALSRCHSTFNFYTLINKNINETFFTNHRWVSDMSYLVRTLPLIFLVAILSACSSEKSKFEGDWAFDVSSLSSNTFEGEMQLGMYGSATIHVEGDKLTLAMPGMAAMAPKIARLTNEVPSEEDERMYKSMAEGVVYKISDPLMLISEIVPTETDGADLTITYSVTNEQELLFVEGQNGEFLKYVRPNPQ